MESMFMSLLGISYGFKSYFICDVFRDLVPLKMP